VIVNILRKTGITLIMISILTGSFLSLPNKVNALSGADFNASRIIDDSVFFNPSTMNASDIQAFLNSKVPKCDTWGTGASGRSGYPTRADWGRANGYPPPYTCLRDYSQSTGVVAANSYCSAIGAASRSAATIIFDVARACNINPQSLIVLLQKEQSLITDVWPWSVQYRSATGYGCPDTAPCDAEYYGFFNQVYNASKQFRRYVQLPNSFNYAAGRTSFVAYQANNPGCSGTNLTIQNGATAALYNYTPYQPNAAALANLYGTGDGCSAYGNRNFWRMFNDWFGPVLGDLVRTPDNGTVYLVSGENKYPIADGSVYSDFGNLGPLRFVTNEYIGNKVTGPTLGHMVGGIDGTLYFVNAGIKLPFSSCGQVADYGYSCEQVITLTDGQLTRLYTGPAVTQVYSTTNGKMFYVDDGKKREVFDQTSLTANSLPTASNTLLEAGLNYIGYGEPVIRNNVVALNRANGDNYYYSDDRYIKLDNDNKQYPSFTNLPHKYLDDASITNNKRILNFTGFIKNGSSSQYYVINSVGKASLSDTSLWPNSYTIMNDSFLSASPNDNSGVVNNRLIKSDSSPTVYYLEAGKKRPIPSWADLVNLNVQPFAINTLSSVSVNSIPTGPVIFAPGSLVKANNSATVYVAKNSTTLYQISSFNYPVDLGLSLNIRNISDADLQTYTVPPTQLKDKVLCNSKNYIASGGQLHEISAGLITEYGYNINDFLDVGSQFCSLTSIGQPMDRFIRVSNGTIYYITGGQKRAFTSFLSYIAKGGTVNNTLFISDSVASSIPSGPNM